MQKEYSCYLMREGKCSVHNGQPYISANYHSPCDFDLTNPPNGCKIFKQADNKMTNATAGMPFTLRFGKETITLNPEKSLVNRI